jgi:LysR family cys regulon transcriptional activator
MDIKLNQLRIFREVVRHNFNVSNAAEALYTSQPAVSAQIAALEDALGLTLFVRKGKRFLGLTEAGTILLEKCESILNEVANFKQMAVDFQQEEKGALIIATTHTQARYRLPPILSAFIQRYPEIHLRVRQGSPDQITEALLNEEVDLSIITEQIYFSDKLVFLPCYRWNRLAVVPKDHPLANRTKPSIEELSHYPLVTYDFVFSKHSAIQEAFTKHGLTPQIVLTATDAEVIKTYVRTGFGVGIIAKMAYDPKMDTDLVPLDISQFFEPSMTMIALRKNMYLRSYMYPFIELFAPHLTKEVVKAAMSGKAYFTPTAEIL